MAQAPSYRNPETGLLRCPIRDLKDCVKEKCFFWKNSTEIDLMADHVKKILPPEVDRSEFKDDNCLLLAASLLAETEFLALADVWRAISSFDLDEGALSTSTPSPPPQGVSLIRAPEDEARASHQPAGPLGGDESESSRADTVDASTEAREKPAGDSTPGRDRPRLVLVDSTVHHKLDTLEKTIAAVLAQLDLLLKRTSKP